MKIKHQSGPFLIKNQNLDKKLEKLEIDGWIMKLGNGYGWTGSWKVLLDFKTHNKK